MNRSTFPVEPEGVVEILDIDLDMLDHALMDLLTSDWQTLDDVPPDNAAVTAEQFSPTL
jgi:hypothetical protein